MKTTLDDLALFGGAPAFEQDVHVGRPNIGDRERLLERVGAILDNRWLTNGGPFVQELEHRLAHMLEARHCVAMCNGTVALEIAIRAAGLAGEVIVPAFTFVATAHALQWQGITPVFCDVDPRTHLLDPAAAERLITPRTTGIIGVHLWGQPCAVEELEALARRRGLRLLFDAAHAFGCSHRGRMVGAFGSAEVFSFHATKVFNAFEGGAVVTNDDALAERVRLMRNFGFADYDTVASVGTNGKMTEVAAAMGLTSLESLDGFVEANRRNYHQYRRELAGLPGLALLRYDEDERANYQYVVLEIDEAAAGVSRDQLLALLWAERVLARRYFYPGCHRMEPYRSLVSPADRPLPVTDALAGRVLCLPTGTAMTPEAIAAVCQIVRLVLERGPAVGARMARMGK